MFNLSGLKTLTGCVTNKAVRNGQSFFIFWIASLSLKMTCLCVLCEIFVNFAVKSIIVITLITKITVQTNFWIVSGYALAMTCLCVFCGKNIINNHINHKNHSSDKFLDCFGTLYLAMTCLCVNLCELCGKKTK